MADRDVARTLRHQATDAERLLWSRLRDQRLAGYKFRRQHPIGPYVVDFACVERHLVVEVDGGQHALDSERARDEERTRRIEAEGFRVLRFWNNEVLTNLEGVLEAILAACERGGRADG